MAGLFFFRNIYHRARFAMEKAEAQQKELPQQLFVCRRMERAMGVEPTSKAWEAFILPMNYARTLIS